jgi:hypothetical protein
MMQTITVIGGDLFHIAAAYLGDATQAVRIAQQNGLTDFFLTGQVTLVIPDVDPNATGGVPPQ